MDDRYMRWVLGRRRGSDGRLIRVSDDMPPHVAATIDSRGMRRVWNPVPYSSMFMQVKRDSGATKEKAMADWKKFMEENPGYGKMRVGG